MVLNESNLLITNIIKIIYNEIKEILSFFSSISEIKTKLYIDSLLEGDTNAKNNLIFLIGQYIDNDDFFQQKIQYSDQINLRKEPGWLRNLPDSMVKNLQIKKKNDPASISDFMVSVQQVLEKTTISSEYGWLSYEKFNPIFYNLKNNFDSFISIYKVDKKSTVLTGGGEVGEGEGQEGGATRQTFLLNIIKELLTNVKDFYKDTEAITRGNVDKFLDENGLSTFRRNKREKIAFVNKLVESNLKADKVIQKTTSQDVILFFCVFLFNYKNKKNLRNIKIKKQKLSLEIYNKLIPKEINFDLIMTNLFNSIYEPESFKDDDNKEDCYEHVKKIFIQSLNLYLLIYFKNNIDFDNSQDILWIVNDNIPEEQKKIAIQNFNEKYDIIYIFFNAIDSFINGIYFYSYNQREKNRRIEIEKLNFEKEINKNIDGYYKKIDKIYSDIESKPTLNINKDDFYCVNCGLEENIIKDLVIDVYTIFVSQKFEKNSITEKFLTESYDLLKISFLQIISDIEMLYNLFIRYGAELITELLYNCFPLDEKGRALPGITTTFLDNIKTYIDQEFDQPNKYPTYKDIIDSTDKDFSAFKMAFIHGKGTGKERIKILVNFLSKLKNFRDKQTDPIENLTQELEMDISLDESDLKGGANIKNSVDLVNNYNNITNPITNQQISLTSLLGKYILRKYIDKTQ